MIPHERHVLRAGRRFPAVPRVFPGTLTRGLTLGLALGLALAAGVVGAAGAARAAPAAPAKKVPLGSLDLEAWDARKDVYFERVTVWRKGCELGYRFTYKRRKAHPIQIRLLLRLDAGPASTATDWTASRKAGAQVAQGRLKTPECWVKKARILKRASFEVLGDAPRETPKDGRVFLGRVTFNRWGSSGDVFYRHIKTWKKGCRIHFQFLYKRRTAVRRRLRMRLTFDQGTLRTQWVRSKKRGWREIVGSRPTPGCWAREARSLRSAAFESERY